MKTERTWGEVLILALLIIAILGGNLLYHHIVYGDAWCAFARCVLTKNIKP